MQTTITGDTTATRHEGESARVVVTTRWKIRRWWQPSSLRVAATTIANRDASKHANQLETKDGKEDAIRDESGSRRKSGQTGYPQCQSSSNSRLPALTICSMMTMVSVDRVINSKIAEGFSYSRKPHYGSNRKHSEQDTRQYPAHQHSEHHHRLRCLYPHHPRHSHPGRSSRQESTSSN